MDRYDHLRALRADLTAHGIPVVEFDPDTWQHSTVPPQWKPLGWVAFRPLIQASFPVGSGFVHDFELVSFCDDILIASTAVPVSPLSDTAFARYIGAIHDYIVALHATPLNGEEWDDRERRCENALYDTNSAAMTIINNVAFAQMGRTP